jgi:hypothetical protein
LTSGNLLRLYLSVPGSFFQINEDLKEENAEKLLNQEIDLDKPGNAQFYCLHCA